jgi:hypothetical protein
MGLPNGNYIGRVAVQYTDQGEKAADIGRSMIKSTPQVTVLCEVASGPHIGEQMPWTGYLSGKAVGRTLLALRLMGFEGDELDDFPDQRPEAEFSFTVGNDDYNGKVTQKIQWINPVGQALDLKELSAQIRPMLAQTQLVEPAPPAAPPPAHSQPTGLDDDIPF